MPCATRVVSLTVGWRSNYADRVYDVCVNTLLRCADAYDPTSEMTFENYCVMMMKHRVFDFLRDDPILGAPRRGVCRLVCEDCGFQFDGKPYWTDVVCPKCKGRSLQNKTGETFRLRSFRLLQFDTTRHRRDDSFDPALVVLERIPADTLTPVAQMEQVDEQRWLADALALLSPRERTILMLCYSGLTLARIGERVGLTESRICQIRGCVLQRLREAHRDGRLSARCVGQGCYVRGAVK